MASFEEKHTLATRYAAWVMRNRMLVILVVLISTVLAALQIKNLDIRNDPDTLLPPSNRYVATNAYGEQKFGMGNIMVIALTIKEGDIYHPWFINLVQEIHRELNTLGSKCREVGIAERVVDAKTAAERVREQVQNLE